MTQCIYVIEDDKNIAELLEIALKTYGYNTIVFGNAEDAIKEIDKNKPDVILCDLMLPGLNGDEAVGIIRKKCGYKNTAIIMITAKDSELDKIKGLDNGADDYITKPFSVMEVMARVRSQIRRICEYKQEDDLKENEISVGRLRLNKKSREAYLGDEILEFTFKEFELVKYLMENLNKPLTREEILNNVWGYEYMGETRTVDIHIKTIRRKLDDAEDMIKTVRGVGYKISDK